MPTLFRTFNYFETARSLIAPGLLLATGLLGPICLEAQSLHLQPATVYLEFIPSHSESSSSLPDAPDAMKTERAAQNPSVHPGVQTTSESWLISFRQRERYFLQDLIGSTAFIASAFQSTIDTVRPLKVGYPSDGVIASGNHPAHDDVPEWGEGAQGYAKRYADRFGQGLVGTTSRYALGEILREDVTYHRCHCAGVLPRTANALVGAYTAHTRSGRVVPSLPAVASPFIASEFAVVAWYPSRYNASDALRISVLNYVAAPFKNLFAEFIGK